MILMLCSIDNLVAVNAKMLYGFDFLDAVWFWFLRCCMVSMNFMLYGIVDMDAIRF